MILTNPVGLLGLLSLPVILALHMLRERQRRFIVSSLNLWSFLDNELRGPRHRRLPFTWLLFLDLSVAALLSLAWAQPQVNLPLSTRNARHLVILLDVSSSMRATEGLSNRLAEAKQEALFRLDNLGSQDVVTVLAFGRTPHWIGDSRQTEQTELAARIRNLQAGETGQALRESIALGLASVDGSMPVEFHILTDGAFPADVFAGLEGFNYPVRWHWFGRPIENQAVLELNATSLGENRYQLFAQVANFGNLGVQREVALQLNEMQVDSMLLAIPAGSKVAQIWQITAESSSQNPAAIRVSLAGEDGFKEDDAATIGLQPGGRLRVTLVAENPAPIQQALQVIPEVDVQVAAPEEYASFAYRPASDLTIFRNYLPEDWPDGDVLVVEPPSTPASAGDLTLVAQARREVPANAPIQVPNPDPLLAGIDFSGVRWSRAWTLVNIPNSFNTLLQAGDAPLLLRGELEREQAGPTRVLVLLADLSRGNFTKHPAFPILIANIVQDLLRMPFSASFNTGEGVRLPALGGFDTLSISVPGEAPLEYRTVWPEVWEHTLEPGLYRFTWKSRAGDSLEYIAGVNAGDEIESDFRLRAWAEAAGTGIPSITGSSPGNSTPLGASSEQEHRPVDLLPWLLGAALLVLFLEATLAWR